MAWTAIVSGDPLPDIYNTVISELFTAVNQRNAVVGISNTSQSPEGSRGDGNYVGGTGNWTDNVNRLRTACTTLITPVVGGINAENCFVKSDYTLWTDTAALLTAAGHGGAWIALTEANARVESFAPVLVQIRDVFAQLIYYRVNVKTNAAIPRFSSSFSSGNGERIGLSSVLPVSPTQAQYNAAVESAWSAAKAASISNPATYNPMSNTFNPVSEWSSLGTKAFLSWSFFEVLNTTPNPDEYYIGCALYGPSAQVSINLTNTLGACIKAEVFFSTDYFYPSVEFYDLSVTVADEFGNSWAVVAAGSSVLNIYAGITVNATNIIDFSISTTEGSTAPDYWGTGLLLVETNTSGFSCKYEPYSGYFYFNITTALTYG